MPDISMCANYKCVRRSDCYRYRAIPFKLQTYSRFRPINGRCQNYMPIVDSDQLREVADIDEKVQGMR